MSSHRGHLIAEIELLATALAEARTSDQHGHTSRAIGAQWREYHQGHMHKQSSQISLFSGKKYLRKKQICPRKILIETIHDVDAQNQLIPKIVQLHQFSNPSPNRHSDAHYIAAFQE